jgi:polar amino acid transport system substrate-binding protein
MKYITSCMGILMILMATSVAKTETITIVADAWPPFNAEPQSNAEGYMVDIARTIFEEQGILVEYRNTPWKRAIMGTRNGTYNAAIGASKTDAKDFIFPKEELARNLLAFYVKKGNTWRFTDLDSIKQIRLATIGGYDYRKWLNDYIQSTPRNSDKVQILLGDLPLQRNLNKLLLDRVDVVVDTEAAIRWEAKRLNILHKIEPAGFGKKPSYCYIAFSPSLPKSPVYAQILSKGIERLRVNGKLQVILNKYGVIDWKNF